MYFSRTQVSAKIPPQYLIEALDDDGDGVEDAGLWDAVADDACQQVNAILGQRYSVPFTGSIPAIVAQAAVLFSLETLYLRRAQGTEEINPWIIPARAIRRKLSKIANGEEPLTPNRKKPGPSVSIVTEPSRTTSKNGSLSA